MTSTPLILRPARAPRLRSLVVGLAITAGATGLAMFMSYVAYRYGPRMAGVLLLAAPVALFVLRRPHHGLMLAAGITVAMPYWTTFAFPQATVPRVAALLAAGGLVTGIAARVELNGLDLSLCALALGIYLSWAFHPESGVPARELVNGLLPLTFYVWARANGTAPAIRAVLWSIALAASLGALTVMFEFFVAHRALFVSGDVRSWYPETGRFIFRPRGIFGSPPGAATVLAMTTLLTLPLLREADRRLRALAWGCVALGTVALGVTFTRGGWIAFGVGVIAYVLLTIEVRRGIRIALRAALVLGPVLALVLPALAQSQTFQFGVLRPGTFADRQVYWRYAFPLTTDSQEHFFFGRGYASMSDSKALDPGLGATRLPVTSAHNDYIRAMIEQGLTGAVLLIVWLMAPLLVAIRAARRLPPGQRALLAACAGAIAAYAVVGLVGDTFFFTPAVSLVALAVGFLSTLAANARRPAGSPRGATA